MLRRRACFCLFPSRLKYGNRTLSSNLNVCQKDKYFEKSDVARKINDTKDEIFEALKKEELEFKLKNLKDQKARETFNRIQEEFREKQRQRVDLLRHDIQDRKEVYREKIKEKTLEQRDKLREKSLEQREKFREKSIEQREKLREKSIEQREKLREKSLEQQEKLREKRREIRERAVRENWYTIPNAISFGRIVIAPVTGYCITHGHYEAALYLNVVSMISDFLDGKIARTWPSQASTLGTALDPLADKITMLAVYSAFAIAGDIPLWLFGTIIGRDVALVLGTSVIRYQTLPPPKTLKRYFDFGLVSVKLNPTWISKTNTVLQFLLPVWLLTQSSGFLSSYDFLTMPFCYLTFSTTFVSTLEYFVFRRDLLTRKKVITKVAN
ncbi:Oidioi.mRNA.OKI2018_I69.chr1.g944.t1.cds [Oikopleura dioica]|uniref:cardiolipin synthase (CMP-forming) n=1 Tax=Oikopleura dioica TaxID=34765 RepID=A0ABN7SLF8_OIKDI|nr:Oidioi.mRNA.OKI2018_I69.chr1.g944.t1.cds [Oikopleura dioica]